MCIIPCHRSYEWINIMYILTLINQFISQFLPSVGFWSINLSYPVWDIPVVCIPHVHHYNSIHYHRQCPRFHPYRSLLFLLCWLVRSSGELRRECSRNCELLTDEWIIIVIICYSCWQRKWHKLYFRYTYVTTRFCCSFGEKINFFLQDKFRDGKPGTEFDTFLAN